MQSDPIPRFKVAARIKGMSAAWHNEMRLVNPREKLRKVMEASKQYAKRVTVTIGDGTEIDNETFERLMRSDVPLTVYKTPRYGFEMATFEFILLK